MKRLPVVLVLAIFLAMLFAPAFVLVEFKLHQEGIARELCVQRDVVEAMRTCHGHCQLSKRFKQLEHEAAAGFPVERIQNRFEPVTPIADPVPNAEPIGLPRSFRSSADPLIARTVEQVDHVPRG